MKSNKLIILIFILVISIVGCSSEKNNDKDISNDNESQETNKEATFGGSLKLAMREPITLNPLTNEERSVDQFLKLIYEPLFEFDENFKPISNLVDSYELGQGGSYITINLKPNITFHNGTALTASDVEHSINTIKNASENSIYKTCIANIQRVNVMDVDTIRIYYKQPYAFYAYNLTFPIISKSMTADSFTPIGTGHYKFVDYTSMKEVNLIAFNKEEVYVENIKAIITKDSEADNNSFDQHVIDLINPIKFDWMQYSDDNSKVISEYTSNFYDFLGFNFSNEILADPIVRKAIANSINRKELIESELLNHFQLSEYPIHPDSWLNEEDNKLIYKLDLETAKSTLKEAGYLDTNDDGIIEGKTETTNGNINFNILVNKDNKLRLSIANGLKESIEKLGVQIVIDSVDSNVFYEKLYASDYDLVLSGWKLSSTPDLTELFHSSFIGTTNFINYTSSNMDSALQGVYKSSNEEELLSNINSFKQVFTNELPYISLYFLNSATITHDNINNKFQPNTDNTLKGIEEIFVD